MEQENIAPQEEELLDDTDEESEEEDSSESYWEARAKKAEQLIRKNKNQDKSRRRELQEKLLNKPNSDANVNAIDQRLNALETTNTILAVKSRTNWPDEVIEKVSQTLGRSLTLEDLENPMIQAGAERFENELRQVSNTPSGRGLNYAKSVKNLDDATAPEKKKAFGNYFASKIKRK